MLIALLVYLLIGIVLASCLYDDVGRRAIWRKEGWWVVLLWPMMVWIIVESANVMSYKGKEVWRRK